LLIFITQLVFGLIVLFAGGHFLVQGATRLALLARLSATVVGLTVVAMGTSLPEMAVSVWAAKREAVELAYGNIIGSSVFNIGMILGISAIVAPLAVKRQTIRIEYPFMLFVALLVVLLGRDHRVDQIEGAALIFLLVLFTVYVIWFSKHGAVDDEIAAIQRDVERTAHLEAGAALAWGKNALLLALGIGALLLGADQVVRGAVGIARAWGVEERLIGLTIVAMGTSLPELATSVVAAKEGEREIALANVIGSNLFNLLAVLGATAAVRPVPVPQPAVIDTWVMLAFSGAMLPLMWVGRRVGRWDGVILLVGFLGYMAYLIAARA
jgi:cation:H+ antiporter